MRFGLTIEATMIACLLSISIFASCAGAAAEASAPSWEEGEGWAAGFEKDLGAEFVDEISAIESELQDLGEIELDEFDVDGNVEFYTVLEITEETSSYYILTADMGQKLLFTLDIEFTASLPDEGTYDVSEGEPPTSDKSIGVGASIDYALWAHADLQIEKESMAIENADLEIHGSTIIEATVSNFPMIESDGTTQSVSYQSMDVWAGADVDIEINVNFSPALDIFQFPFDVGDEWTVESTANISGTVDGAFDATGLPSEATQELFTEDVMVENGITGFPIELDLLIIDEEGMPQITNGVLESQTAPIEFEIECIGSEMTTIPGYGAVEVYTLEIDDGNRFNYSSDVDFMTSMDFDFGDLFNETGVEMPFEIPDDMDFMDESDTSIGSMDVETAQDGIDDIADYQGVISGNTDGGSGGGDDGNAFFFDEPYFGIIIAALVVVVIASVVFAAFKRK